MTKQEKPTSAVAGVTNVVKGINAALATLPRDVQVTVTTTTANGQSTGGDSLLDALRSAGLQ